MPRNTIKSIRLYRGTTQQHSDYAGPVGEITVDTEKYTVVVQNGVTGGVPLAREDTVVSLTNRIAVEESVRETADTALRTSITDEVSARKSADTTLGNNIASEASARKAADTALQKSITDEASVRETTDTAIQKSVTDEVSARKAADTALQKSITDEASARETADNAFQKQIDNSLRRGAVIGEVRWFAMSAPPEGWLVCNGADVAISDYPALYNAIGNTFLPEDVPASSVTFDLPNLIGKVPWGATSVGTVLDAGLPNITGQATYISSDGVDQDKYPDTGCFFWGSYNNTRETSNTNGSAKRDFKFDASRSNSIYGKSSTVQPPALCLLPCIRYE